MGLADSIRIMATNAYQLLTGTRGVDGAPVADVGKYNVRTVVSLCVIEKKGVSWAWASTMYVGWWVEWLDFGWLGVYSAKKEGVGGVTACLPD